MAIRFILLESRQNLVGKKFFVSIADALHVITEGDLVSVVEPQNFIAHRAHLRYRMGNENGSCSASYYFLHFCLAFFAEGSVTDREHLVENKYIGVNE